jgi:hypothetical protein
VGVAVLGLIEAGALLAAVGYLGRGGALAALLAGATRLGARRPSAEGRHNAINRAGVIAALAGLGQQRAGVAAVLGMSDDGAGALLRAAATSLGARAPAAEGGHLAVDGASAVRAGLLLVEFAARDATESGSSSCLAGTSLSTGAARLGAFGPGGPRADDAINRAGLLVAGLLFG